MIQITKLNKDKAYISADLVEIVEASPDTAITMQGGKRLVVLDSVEDVVKKIIRYKQLIHTSVAIRKKEGE